MTGVKIAKEIHDDDDDDDDDDDGFWNYCNIIFNNIDYY